MGEEFQALIGSPFMRLRWTGEHDGDLDGDHDGGDGEFGEDGGIAHKH